MTHTITDITKTVVERVSSLTGVDQGGGESIIQINMDWSTPGSVSNVIFQCERPTGQHTDVITTISKGAIGYNPGYASINTYVSSDGRDDSINGYGTSQIGIQSSANNGTETSSFNSGISMSNNVNNAFDSSSFSLSTFSSQSASSGSYAQGGFGTYISSSDHSNVKSFISSEIVGIGDDLSDSTSGFDITQIVSIKASSSVIINTPLLNLTSIETVTSATDGYASALPTTPAGYLPVTIDGYAYVLPFYLP